MALTNKDKAQFNARQTGVVHLGPILNEIYDATTVVDARVAALESRVVDLERKLAYSGVTDKTRQGAVKAAEI